MRDTLLGVTKPLLALFVSALAALAVLTFVPGRRGRNSNWKMSNYRQSFRGGSGELGRGVGTKLDTAPRRSFSCYHSLTKAGPHP